MKKGKLVIKHHGLIILRDNNVKLVSDTPYLSVADGGLEGILDAQSITHTYNDKILCEEEAEKEWRKAQTIFQNMGINVERIIRLMTELREAESKKDLVRIYRDLISTLTAESREFMEGLYRKQPDLVLSMMTKSIVVGYVKSQFRRTMPSKTISLEVRKAKGEPLQEIMDDGLDLDFSIPAPNGVDKVVAKVFNDQLDDYYINRGSECWNCSNGYVSCCEKIADYPEKKDIEDYPFITDGFQWYVKGELDKFVVTKCENSQKAPTVSYTSGKDRLKRRDAMALIHMLYREVDTEKEAQEIDDRNKVLGHR